MALGLGEGGKILRPLGIAVSGGLWFSTFFTLFLVPTFQYLLLKRAQRKKTGQASLEKPSLSGPPLNLSEATSGGQS